MRAFNLIKVRATGSPVPALFGASIVGEVSVPDVAYYGRRIASGELERVLVSEIPEPVPASFEIGKAPGKKASGK